MKKIALSTLITIICASASVKSFANDGTLTLAGETAQVVKLVQAGLVDAIPDGNFQDPRGRTGGVRGFKSFFQGQGWVAIVLKPMASKSGNKLEAFSLEVSSSAQLGDAKSQSKKALATIESMAGGMGVKVLKNEGDFIPLITAAGDCFERLKDDQELAGIKYKVALSGGSMSLMQLADDAFPSPEEKALLSKWASKRDECYDARRMTTRFYAPDPREAEVIRGYELTNARILSLFKGEMNYGQFNTTRMQAASASQQQINQATIQMQSQSDAAESERREREQRLTIERQRAYAEQQKAVAMQAQADAAKAEAARSREPIRVETAPINCRSVAIGNSIQTNCN